MTDEFIEGTTLVSSRVFRPQCNLAWCMHSKCGTGLLTYFQGSTGNQQLYSSTPAAAVRDAVIDAVEDLYLRGRTPQDAAQALLDLSHSSNLGACHPAARCQHYCCSGLHSQTAVLVHAMHDPDCVTYRKTTSTRVPGVY